MQKFLDLIERFGSLGFAAAKADLTILIWESEKRGVELADGRLTEAAFVDGP